VEDEHTSTAPLMKGQVSRQQTPRTRWSARVPSHSWRPLPNTPSRRSARRRARNRITVCN